MDTLGQFFDTLARKEPTLTTSLSCIIPRSPSDQPILELFGEIDFREKDPHRHDTFRADQESDRDIGDRARKDYRKNCRESGENYERCERRLCLRCTSNPGMKSRNGGEFPPSISSIGTNGRPWVYYQSIKEDGRCVIKEITIPCRECLHAVRENGRLLLHLGHPKNDHSEFGAQDEEDDEGKMGEGVEEKRENIGEVDKDE
ncbi:uncharacterized protein LOC109724764 [Ananas comosus]|uniref:Uncharacterized protein LOC109724764 n=2 Tax=Ananas comosus TaxID=4615 RepID=A0A6P5GUS9_ANACO|nr:uncharacterized protein LOC109724764 [Ananas comosus]CAD1818052.1 unnamed protein product [Ananas comosus var. bracteatus]